MWDARTKWKDLGEALGMDATKLDAIAIKQRDDPGNCLRDMLSDWLRGSKGPARVWSTITAALRAATVDLGTVAEEIEKEYKLASHQGDHFNVCILFTRDIQKCRVFFAQLVHAAHYESVFFFFAVGNSRPMSSADIVYTL